MQTLQKIDVSSCQGKPVVQVPAQQGEKLCSLLASEGIDSTVVTKIGTPLAVLEMDEDVNVECVQTILSHWDQDGE